MWSNAGDYAVSELYAIKVYKGSNNALSYELKTDYIVDGLSGGVLLGARSAEFIVFYHWETAKVIRKIDVCPRKVIWSEGSALCALATQEELYLLRFRQDLLE